MEQPQIHPDQKQTFIHVLDENRTRNRLRSKRMRYQLNHGVNMFRSPSIFISGKSEFDPRPPSEFFKRSADVILLSLILFCKDFSLVILYFSKKMLHQS